MITRAVRLLAATLGAMFACAVIAGPVGGEEPQVCTVVGCESGVSVDVRSLAGEGRQVTVCIDRTCKRAGREDAVRITRRYEEGQPVTVRVVVRTDAGKVLGRVRRTVGLKAYRPNGPDCPPLCLSRSLRWDAEAKMLGANR